MNRSRTVVSLALCTLAVLGCSVSAPLSRAPLSTSLTEAALSSLTERTIARQYARLPLSFEANRGQSHQDVQFLSRGAGYSLFLTASEAVLSLNPARDTKELTGSVIRLRLLGANPDATVAGLDPLPGKSNYFLGPDPKNWHTEVPHYAKVQYASVYPGIDLQYYGKQQQLEYDFIVAPGADPAQIRFAFEGAERLVLDAEGKLSLRTPHGELIQHQPLIYQEIEGKRMPIDGGYVLGPESTEISFRLAAYDPTLPLIIDPIISYSTFLGGSKSDASNDIAVDSEGSVYVVGGGGSPEFPTTPGTLQPSSPTGGAFITKLTPAGDALVYSTYLVGIGPLAIALDSAGNAYLAGGANSSGVFPTTPGAFDRSFNGGFADVIVVKLNPTGSALLYSTYLGGSGTSLDEVERATGIALDPAGNVYITGITNSADFPTTPGAVDSSFGGFFDTFIAKLDATGSELLYSTLLGELALNQSIAIDTDGNAYVAGLTFSPTIPSTPGALDDSCGTDGQCNFGNINGSTDGFVAKLNTTGTAPMLFT